MSKVESKIVGSHRYITSEELKKQPKHLVICSLVGSKSHIKGIMEISQILQERGYKITYMSTAEQLRWASAYNFSTYSIGNQADFVGPTVREIGSNSFHSRYESSHLLISKKIGATMVDNYQASFLNIHDAFHHLSPDAVVCDFSAPSCVDAVNFNHIPLIVGFQSLDFGGLAHSSFITDSLDFDYPITTENSNFFTRFQLHVIEPIRKIYHFAPLMLKLKAIRNKLGVPHDPKYILGNWNNGIQLANSMFGFDPPRFLPPSFHVIGPIKSNIEVPLTLDLTKFLNEHDKCMYIAFGTNAKLPRQDQKTILLGVIQAIKENVINGAIWAIDPVEYAQLMNGYDNNRDLQSYRHQIYILKWAPQESILAHNNLKLFMTHGGSESVFESLYNGVPLITMPYYLDQPRNARKLLEMGISEYIDRFIFTPDSLLHSISTIMWKSTSDPVTLHLLLKFKRLARFGALKKFHAANVIEEFMLTANACQGVSASSDVRLSCRLDPWLPVSNRMSAKELYDIDIYICLLVLLFVAVYYSAKVTSKCFNLAKPFCIKSKELKVKKA